MKRLVLASVLAASTLWFGSKHSNRLHAVIEQFLSGIRA